MIQVGGKPIIQHNIELLARHGFDKIFINLHYQPAAIVDALGDGRRFGVSIAYSYEERLLGTAGAADKLARELDGAFLLVYGDNLSDINLTALRALHEKRDAAATIAVFKRADVAQSGVVGINDNGKVYAFQEKPRPDRAFSNWVNAGYIFFSERVFKYIPQDSPSDFGRDVLPMMLEAGERLWAYRMQEKLWWIDSLADYERTLREFEEPA